jgi:rSAM/selenodomain-associated transferase 2
MQVSVIVPVLDEERCLVASLATARLPGVREIIVVDGGSSDGTVQVAKRLADRTLIGQRGRARQMNAGARVASGAVLLFLHADTLLPRTFVEDVRRGLSAARAVGGRFDVRFSQNSPLLTLTAWLMNLRSRATGISTGDQAMFVRREVFETLGGFADIPLMEDVEFSRRLKRAGRIACLRSKVTTSSRRWLRRGVIRTILLMWSLRLLFFCGVSPERMSRLYPDER